MLGLVPRFSLHFHGMNFWQAISGGMTVCRGLNSEEEEEEEEEEECTILHILFHFCYWSSGFPEGRSPVNM